MNKTEALKRLKALGTAQNRKVYARHGVQGEMFGVSYANLTKLKREVKIDHDLAEKLWASGNHDARVFATMIADPARMTARLLDAWVKDLRDYVVTDAFAGIAAKSSVARKRMEKWTAAKSEWVATAGWGTLSNLLRDGAELADTELERHLKAIEAKIHSSKNRVRYAMNNALIGIGVRSAKLEKKATAAAGRIGRVEVDHGETGCKTPDAAAYIKKTLAYQRKKKAKKKTARS